MLHNPSAPIINQRHNTNTSRLNKKIGDYLLQRIGIGFIASDFLAEIPRMTKEFDFKGEIN